MHEQEYPWAAIRHAYLHGECTVNQICKKFKVSRTRFYIEARRQGWPSRKQRSKTQGADFIEQMMGVLARQLVQLDGRISTESSVDAVALGNIAKTYEKIQELSNSAIGPNKKNSQGGNALAELRKELSEKLASLSESD